MALSGSFNIPRTAGSTYMSYKCTWSASQNVSGNYSDITVWVYASKSSASTAATSCNVTTTVSLGGQSKQEVGLYMSIQPGQSNFLLFAKSGYRVYHNDDGSKSINISVDIDGNTILHANGSSGTIWLNQIPRKTPCPSLTGFIKSSYNLTLSPRSNSFTHSLKIVFGGLTRWLQANGTLGTSEYKFSSRSPLITIPAEFYTQFPNYEGVGIFYLYTYNGNTNLGYNTGTLNAQCNPAYKPTITEYSIKDINETTLDITDDENDIIQNASTAKIVLSFSNGDVDDPRATITSTTINGVSFTGNTVTIVEPSSNSFVISITNNRNATNTITISAAGVLLPYIKPTFNITSLKRPEPTGSGVDVDYNGNFYAGRFVGSHNVSPDLMVGDDIKLSNLRFNFPNNLYESIEEQEHTTDIVITDSYKIVENFRLETSTDSETGTTSIIGCYAIIALSSINNNEESTYIPIYIASGTPNNDTFIYTVEENRTQLPVPSSYDFGVITNVNNTLVPYQYMSKYVSEEAVKNTLNISWKYKEKNTETWITGGTLNPIINIQENTYTNNESIGNIFDYRKQYDFEFTLTDRINTIVLPMSISRGLPIIWWTGDDVHILGDVYVSGTVHTNE